MGKDLLKYFSEKYLFANEKINILKEGSEDYAFWLGCRVQCYLDAYNLLDYNELKIFVKEIKNRN